MTVTPSLYWRWQRAQRIDRAAITALGQGRYRVPSSSGIASYTVEIRLNADGRLIDASCTCPDYHEVTLAPPTLRGVRVCKHVLAACMKATDSLQTKHQEVPQ